MSTDTIGSGGDYSTIALWSADVKAIGTLTEDEIGQLTDDAAYTYGGTNDLAFGAVTLSGFTITLESTNLHDGDFGTGARVEGSAGFVRLYAIEQMIGNDLSLTNTSSSDFSAGIRALTGCTLNRCIVKVTSTSTTTNVYVIEVHTGSTIKVCRTEGGEDGFRNRIAGNTIEACTAIGAVNGFNTTTTHTGSLQNNVGYGNTNDFAGTWSGTSNNNASEDGTHPGTSGVTISGDPFDADGYTPESSGQLDGAGVDLSITLDAANNSYESTPSIGAYEVVASGASTLVAETAAYTYTGTAGSLLLSAILGADTEQYTYSGTAADLNLGRVLAADTAQYTYSGTSADLTFAGAGDFTLSADTAQYTYSGTNTGLLVAAILDAETAQYTYSGTAATLTHNFNLIADTVQYTYSGTNANFSYNRVLGADSGGYIYTGASAALTTIGDIWTDRIGVSTTWTDK